jgi:hypothetical protein
VNAPNDQHALLCFHLSGYVRSQFSVAGIDLARFQLKPLRALRLSFDGPDTYVRAFKATSKS